EDVPHLAASGRTSFPADKDVPKSFYRVAGFKICGERTVRVDILERLADLIRPAVAYRPGLTAGEPPPGTADRDGFVVTVGMTSLVGCSGESFASILRALGYVSEQRKGPAITVPLIARAPTEPVQPSANDVASSESSEKTADAAEETSIALAAVAGESETAAVKTGVDAQPQETAAEAVEPEQVASTEET